MTDDTPTPSPATRNALLRRLMGWAAVLVLVLIGAYLVDYWRAWASTDLVAWRTDDMAAMDEALQANKPVLLLYTASWCGPCQQLKAGSFADAATASRIEAVFVPVKMDVDQMTPQQSARAQSMGISGLPTLVALDPQGQPIDFIVGNPGNQRLNAWIDAIASR